MTKEEYTPELEVWGYFTDLEKAVDKLLKRINSDEKINKEGCPEKGGASLPEEWVKSLSGALGNPIHPEFLACEILEFSPAEALRQVPSLAEQGRHAHKQIYEWIEHYILMRDCPLDSSTEGQIVASSRNLEDQVRDAMKKECGELLDRSPFSDLANEYLSYLLTVLISKKAAQEQEGENIPSWAPICAAWAGVEKHPINIRSWYAHSRLLAVQSVLNAVSPKSVVEQLKIFNKFESTGAGDSDLLSYQIRKTIELLESPADVPCEHHNNDQCAKKRVYPLSLKILETIRSCKSWVSRSHLPSYVIIDADVQSCLASFEILIESECILSQMIRNP